MNTWRSKNRIQSRWSIYIVRATCSPPSILSQIDVELLNANKEPLSFGFLREKHGISMIGKTQSPGGIDGSGRRICVVSPDYIAINYWDSFLHPVINVAIPVNIDQSLLPEVQSVNVKFKSESIEETESY